MKYHLLVLFVVTTISQNVYALGGFFNSDLGRLSVPFVLAEGDCDAAVARAKTICSPGSPGLNTGLTVASMVVATPIMDQLLPHDQCEAGMDANDIIRASFAAWMAACEIAKGYCTSACTSKAGSPPAANLTQMKDCQANMMSIMMGIANIAQATKGREESASCVKSTCAAGQTCNTDQKVDCTVTANINSEYCTCMRDPLQAKCASVDSKFAQIQSRTNGARTASNNRGLGDLSVDTGAGTGAGSDSAFAGPGAGTNSGAAPSSGGSYGSALGADKASNGFAASGASNKKDGDTKDKKGIVAGYEAGGGGGSRTGFNGKSGSAIGAEMRKQIEDMKRKIASVEAAKQITGANGKSLFSKINDSFSRSEKSLLPAGGR